MLLLRNLSAWWQHRQRQRRYDAYHKMTPRTLRRLLSGLELVVGTPIPLEGKITVRVPTLQTLLDRVAFYRQELTEEWVDAVATPRPLPPEISDKGDFRQTVWRDQFFATHLTLDEAWVRLREDILAIETVLHVADPQVASAYQNRLVLYYIQLDEIVHELI